MHSLLLAVQFQPIFARIHQTGAASQTSGSAEWKHVGQFISLFSLLILYPPPPQLPPPNHHPYPQPVSYTTKCVNKFISLICYRCHLYCPFFSQLLLNGSLSRFFVLLLTKWPDALLLYDWYTIIWKVNTYAFDGLCHGGGGGVTSLARLFGECCTIHFQSGLLFFSSFFFLLFF